MAHNNRSGEESSATESEDECGYGSPDYCADYMQEEAISVSSESESDEERAPAAARAKAPAPAPAAAKEKKKKKIVVVGGGHPQPKAKRARKQTPAARMKQLHRQGEALKRQMGKLRMQLEVKENALARVQEEEQRVRETASWERRACVRCEERPASWMAEPCGHVLWCGGCEGEHSPFCPVCEARVAATRKVFP